MSCFLGRRLFSLSWSRMLSSKISNINSYSSCCCSSPWLMLQPKLNNEKNDMMSFSFYSLAENRVVTPRPHSTINMMMLPKPIHDIWFCGSSHGWLALFNPHTFALFLYDPISHRQIKLPPFHHLPNFSNPNERNVHKLILSSSPDEEDCRAVMIYNCLGTLAFCCPGLSNNEWAPIGKTHHTWYDDIAYSTTQNLFYAFNRRDYELETWDLSDPSSPRMLNTVKTYKPYYRPPMEDDDDDFSDSDELVDESPKDSLPIRTQYLVVTNENDVLLLTRYVMWNVAPDGSYAETCLNSSPPYPHMTIDFSIQVYDQEEGDLKPLQESAGRRRRRSLGDLALFIGSQSDSLALSATRFPELKPNSIYFTDPFLKRYDPNSRESFGGHDIGIFDLENRTISPCYYPCNVRSLKRLVPSPMWFFPRGGSGLLSE